MKTVRTFLDKAAISLSLLCIIHCLLAPIVVAVIPFMAVLPLENEFFHQLLVWLVLPTSLIGLTLSCKKHNQWNIAIWGLVGLSIVVFALIFGHDLVGQFGEKLLTLIGSLMIAWVHIQNYRQYRLEVCQ